MLDSLQETLDQLERGGLRRHCQKVEAVEAGRIQIDGRWLVHLSSNSALGLHLHPRVKAAAATAIEEWGTGAGSARLLGGEDPLHRALEEQLAQFKQAEAALVFSTGYMANLGMLTALVKKEDCVICDHLNHASLIDACRLTGATLRVYPHRDMNRLSTALKPRPGRFKRLWVVTEGLFSMDGDIAPLPEIIQLTERSGAWLLLDDAHATGVLGATGRGSLERFGLAGPGISPPEHLIQMGSLSKGLGSLGGFLAGPRAIIETVRNQARSFIYTTALPPASAAAALEALNVLQEEPQLRVQLWKNIRLWILRLEKAGVKLISKESHIVPFQAGAAGFPAGSSEGAMALSRALLKAGFFAPGIRPPTVPAGHARIRTTVNLLHTEAELTSGAEMIERLIQESAQTHK